MADIHEWTSREVSMTIDIALTCPPRSPQRRAAAEALSASVSAATPWNPLTVSAAKTAIRAACLAIDGDYTLAAGDLTRQIVTRRAKGLLSRKYSVRQLTPDERRLDRLIDACLESPPGEEREHDASRAHPDLRLDTALPMIDDAIDGRYRAVEVLRGLKQRTMMRRSEGTLVREYPWVPVAPTPLHRGRDLGTPPIATT